MENFVPTDKQKEEFAKIQAGFIERLAAIPGLMERYTELVTEFNKDKNVEEEKMKEMYDNFKKFDVNKDGKLDLAEYTNFIRNSENDAKEKYGDWPVASDDDIKELYLKYEALSEGSEITEDDFTRASIVMKAVRKV